MAVIAAFRPTATIIETVRCVVDQVDQVIVVDDASGSRWSEVFRQIEEAWGDQAEVLHLDQNSGIAAALNRGVERALDLDATMVLTLDQDSHVSADYVASARTAAEKVDARGRRFAAIAAGVQSGRAVRPVTYADRGDRVTPTLEAIQSGLLIPRDVLAEVGMFDESLFIDCVDTDFVIRAARVGLTTYLARDCEVTHALGTTIETPAVRSTRSGTRSFAFHPAWRRYYISRNRAVMIVRHGVHRPRWAALNLLGESVQFARSLAFGPDKDKQSAAFALGIIDAVRGRRGRLRGRPAVYLGASA